MKAPSIYAGAARCFSGRFLKGVVAAMESIEQRNMSKLSQGNEMEIKKSYLRKVSLLLLGVLATASAGDAFSSGSAGVGCSSAGCFIVINNGNGQLIHEWCPTGMACQVIGVTQV